MRYDTDKQQITAVGFVRFRRNIISVEGMVDNGV